MKKPYNLRSSALAELCVYLRPILSPEATLKVYLRPVLWRDMTNSGLDNK